MQHTYLLKFSITDNNNEYEQQHIIKTSNTTDSPEKLFSKILNMLYIGRVYQIKRNIFELEDDYRLYKLKGLEPLKTNHADILFKLGLAIIISVH